MFPARAGMSPKKHGYGSVEYGVPRASGDEPYAELPEGSKGVCSPRERG